MRGTPLLLIVVVAAATACLDAPDDAAESADPTPAIDQDPGSDTDVDAGAPGEATLPDCASKLDLVHVSQVTVSPGPQNVALTGLGLVVNADTRAFDVSDLYLVSVMADDPNVAVNFALDASSDALAPGDAYGALAVPAQAVVLPRIAPGETWVEQTAPSLVGSFTYDTLAADGTESPGFVITLVLTSGQLMFTLDLNVVVDNTRSSPTWGVTAGERKAGNCL